MPTIVAERYRLERILGRGGMGEVWLAQDTLLGRQVAAKRIGARGASERDLRRSQQEARVTAMLDSPYVVRVFDLVLEDDEQWLVMELVESENLAQLVRRVGALPPTGSARIVHQAAQALCAAHTAGIVHRDVKPSNLLVTPVGEVKLGDFGIARLEGDVGVTRTGQLVGSPGYLAPEVGTGSPATSASDMWSLGATLFHAVEGHPPYETVDGNVIGTLYRIVNDPPPAATRAGWVAPLVANLMVHDPARRWTAQQVSTYLGQALAQRPDEFPERSRVPADRGSGVPTADPALHTSTLPTTAPRVEPQDVEPQRRRLPVTSLAAVVLALVVVVVVVVAAVLVGRQALGGSGNAATPSAGSGPSTSSSANPATASKAGMTAFIQDYLATAPTDPATAFARLTPEFQRESKGIDGYRRFWDTITSATATRIDADPATMTVSYDVAYVLAKGRAKTSTDTVRLQLSFAHGTYLIAGEAT